MASSKGLEELPSACKWVVAIPKQNDDAGYGGCRSIEGNYEKKKVIGKGTYGEVFLAVNLKTQEQVALKKIRMENEKEGFPITAIREIKLLKRLKHPNVICLKEIVRSRAHAVNNMKGSIYMVFDYMDHDMTGLMERMKRKLQPRFAKCYIQQLIKGLFYCHKQRVLHRDLKLSNLLVNNKGELKIADFGLARIADLVNEKAILTNKVITLWYRPPELLLGATHYGPQVDIWSLGCIIYEILTGGPLFPGADEPEQLNRICKMMGNITERTMPGCSHLQLYHMAKQDYGRGSLKKHLESKKLDPQAIDMLTHMLSLDPNKRLTAEAAYMHPYFKTHPLAAKPEELPKMPASHEKVMKEKREASKMQGMAGGKRTHAQMEEQEYQDPEQFPRGQMDGHMLRPHSRQRVLPPSHPPAHPLPHQQMHANGANYMSHPGSSKGSGRSDAGYGMQGPVAPYGRPPMPHNHYPASNYAQPPMRPLHGATHYPPRAMQGHPPFRQDHPQSRQTSYGEQPAWVGRRR